MSGKTDKMILLSTLKLNKDNPRKISDEAFKTLKESIKRDPQFMELRPMIVDENDIIIGGNQRYRALVELKRHSVPSSWVVRAKGLTDAQRKRFVVLDNSPEGMAGYWDFDTLLKGYEMPELLQMGFKFPEKLNFQEIWKGMPEFVQEEIPERKIVVHFETNKDVEAFAKIIKQKITSDTQYVWFPFKPKKDMTKVRYEGEP